MKRAAIIAVVVVLAGLAGRLIDMPALAGGFKGDVGTYVEMTYSIADDFDLQYEQRDLLRFNLLYGTGPEGIFLKKTDISTPSRLEYAKAMAYPLFAAPFAKLGGLGGMFMFNVLLLVACAWCAAMFAAARVGSTWGWAIGFLFIAASSVPAWTVVLSPEVFNFSLALFAYFLWLYKEVRPVEQARDGDLLGSVWSDVGAAALLALAAYSKPSNAAMIAPMVAYALWKRMPVRAMVIAAVFAAGAVAWFGATRVASGEFNYQGGARKTFYGHFPFDADGSTFENAKGAKDMVTAGEKGISEEILWPGHQYFWQTIGHNMGYFLWGRDSGLIPYFFPGALLLALWLARIRKAEFWQVCIFVAAAGAAGFMIFWWPYTWNGAGGPIGNRYFLALYPMLLFLLPKETGAWTAIASGAGGMAFLWPIFGHPFLANSEPWLHPATVPLRFLPVERTMLNEIPLRLHGQRYKIPYGDPRHSFLYRMDGNAYNLEDLPPDGLGFWIAGDASTEVVVATEWPATHPQLRVVNDRVANTFKANWGGSKCRLELQAGESATCELDTADSVWAHGSFFYSMKMSTSAGFVPGGTDPRPSLGLKVFPVFSGK
jgi:hypothetical protein